VVFRLTALVLALVSGLVCVAHAELLIIAQTYRTGPYANNGIPSSDGFADYFTLLNERDGGIGGEKIVIEECEFGYNTVKGVECYSNNRTRGGLVWTPLSTGTTYGMIPLTREDGAPMLTMGYGRTSAADGAVFDNVFNFPANYWQGAAAQIRYIKEVTPSGLAGLKIGLVYHNSAYGKEPIPTLQALAAREGFTLNLYAVDHPGDDQNAIWPAVKADANDWALLWGWGVMNPTALRTALKVGFPIDRVFGVWWSANESDVKRIGAKAKGYKAINFHAVGTSFSVYNALNDYVYFAGKAAGLANNLGTSLYNRGLLAAMFAAEGIRNAQRIHNTAKITPQMMRDGLEAIDLSAEDLNGLGFEDYLPPVKATCANHGGQGLVAVNEWDPQLRGWRQITDYYAPDMDLLGPMIRADADAFAAENGVTRRACP
jgi:branched-chain amino acid transport system substrate-binding protein